MGQRSGEVTQATPRGRKRDYYYFDYYPDYYENCFGDYRCRRRIPQVLQLITYLYHLDYGFAVTMSYLSIVFATFHIVWFVEFYLHGILRFDKFKYLYLQLPFSTYYFEERFMNYSLHPVYNVIGFIFLQAAGMLIFRVCCCYNRPVVVFIHAVLTSMSVPFAAFGWIIIRKFYKETKWIQPMTSFHAHLGVYLFIITAFQIISGIIVFVFLRICYPYRTAVFRTQFTAYHNYIGYSAHLLAVAATLSGLSHAVNYTHPHTYMTNYMQDVLTKDFATENHAIAMSHYGYIHLTFGISCLLVYYTLAKEDFRYRGRVLAARDNTDDDFYH